MLKKFPSVFGLALGSMLTALALLYGPVIYAQLQTSGTTVILGTGVASIGTVGLNAGTNAIGSLTTGVASIGTVGLNAGTNAIGSLTTGVASIGTVGLNAGTNAIGSLTAGTALIGRTRDDEGCALATPFISQTVGVAVGAGTTVTATTTCVTTLYANNITNSAVTLRVADRQGSPVIWVGGNADFSIAANSNVQFPVHSVLFTSGITAIAGTASAINLYVAGLQ